MSVICLCGSKFVHSKLDSTIHTHSFTLPYSSPCFFFLYLFPFNVSALALTASFFSLMNYNERIHEWKTYPFIMSSKEKIIIDKCGFSLDSLLCVFTSLFLYIFITYVLAVHKKKLFYEWFTFCMSIRNLIYLCALFLMNLSKRFQWINAKNERKINLILIKISKIIFFLFNLEKL